VISLIDKSLGTIESYGEPSIMEKLKKFIDVYLVAHFEFEENELFPIILKIGSPEENHLIRELQIEHVQILDEITQFNDLLSSGGYHSKETVQIKEIHWYSKKIIYMVIQHARKEDRELLPILKKYENYF
ncbi:hemerythrin domain-containing protein, partial [Bacteroidota bacterium]